MKRQIVVKQYRNICVGFPKKVCVDKCSFCSHNKCSLRKIIDTFPTDLPNAVESCYYFNRK